MKINLRPITKDDLEWILRHRNDPVLYNCFNQAMPLTMEQELSWYENEVLNKKTFAFNICINNTKIGYIALQNINWITRSAEVSHFIDPEYDPLFITCAHAAICQVAFNALNLNRIHSICFCFNKVYEVLEKLGFKREGVAKEIGFKNGKYTDGYYMSLMREDFKKMEKDESIS